MNYHLYINDTIGWTISAAYVRSELAKNKGKHCDVFISSLGGDVATALQIRQMLQEHGDVTAYLHGFVASAATLVATGAGHVKMGEFALFMIHKCSAWQEQWGQMNADDIAAAIEKLSSARQALDSIDRVIGSIYAKRTGKELPGLTEMMKAETWLSATEAKAEGFVDEIIPDEYPTRLTDEIRHRIVACGYPVPETGLAAPTESGSFTQRLRRELRALFSQPLPEDTSLTSTKNDKNMNKDYKAVLALLQVNGLAVSEDGRFPLTAIQMQAVNDRLAALAAEKQLSEEKLAAAQARLSELQARVDALQKSDGDETAHIEGTADKGDFPSHAANARADYDRMKGIL